MAETQGLRVGFLGACADGRRLHIEQLQVLLEHQGRGVGGGLLAAAETWARANGFELLSLTTFRQVPWNGPFYARQGFRELGPDEMPVGLRAAYDNELRLGWPDRCAMAKRL